MVKLRVNSYFNIKMHFVDAYLIQFLKNAHNIYIFMLQFYEKMYSKHTYIVL